MTDAWLTDDEHALVHKLGECASEYVGVLADAAGVEGANPLPSPLQHDVGEFVAHIHDLQHAVMARAAIRAYPDLYRQ